jgi:MFS family permease
MIRMSELHALAKHLTASGETPKQSTLQSLREGLAYVVQTPSVLLIITVIGVISLFGINFNVILPLFATDVLHSGAMGFGFLSAAFGLGSLLSALWLAWGNRKPSVQYVLIAALVFAVLEIIFAFSHLYVLSLILIATVGFAMIAFSANSNTALQTVTPDHLRGRVMSVYMVVFAGSVPLGNLFTGGLAHVYGASIALLVGGSLSLIAAIVGWILRSSAEKSLAEASPVRS